MPEQDTESFPEGATLCGVTGEGTQFPFLFFVAVEPTGSPGSVDNLATLLDDYDGMEQIDGIGDRALYWDQDTTYQGGTITDHPILAFEDGPANVTITLRVDSLGRGELEHLAAGRSGPALGHVHRRRAGSRRVIGRVAELVSGDGVTTYQP